MAFPLPTNVTFDLYRFGNAPPASPDLAGVKGALVARPENLKATNYFTHWIDVPLGTDIRPGNPGPDTIYVPDKNGTPFSVVAYERIRAGAGNDYKRAYLRRGTPNWPTNDL